FAATLVMGTASVVSALVGLVNSKILALYVGPVGIGVLAQLVNFNVLVIGLASLGLGDGIIKYVSEWQSGDEWDRLRSFLATVLFTLAVVSVLMSAVLAVFAPDISALLFDSRDYAV